MAENLRKGATPLRKRLAFAGVAVCLGMGLVEGSARVAWLVQFSDEEDKLIRSFLRLDAEWDPNLVSNYVPHHYLVYTLNPESFWHHERYFGGRPQHYVNSLGFRGPEVTSLKAPGVFRIVCVGGSTTFGLGEPEERLTYPAQVERILNEWFEAPRFEVINAGTPGWTSAESLINLQFRLLELSPDLIVSYDGVNDTFAMRKAGEGMPDASTFRKIVQFPSPSPVTVELVELSYFLRYGYYVLQGPEAFAADINALAVKANPSNFQENLDQATGKYFRRNTRNLVATAKANGIGVLLVTMGHGPWHPAIGVTNQIYRDLSGQSGALLLDFEPLSRPEFFLEDNIHLTRAGNAALAQAVAEQIGRSSPAFSRRPVLLRPSVSGTRIVPE
ncbi:MAG: hypothetical protein HY791_20320 [Deltaproteobacteria bacterium]|nr:hypothetical protein [Deltaproteobacteria bacterium]